MIVEVVRRLMWRRRVHAAQAWRDAQRRETAEHNAARQRIIDQAVAERQARP